jgi:hypothetical protein
MAKKGHVPAPGEPGYLERELRFRRETLVRMELQEEERERCAARGRPQETRQSEKAFWADVASLLDGDSVVRSEEVLRACQENEDREFEEDALRRWDRAQMDPSSDEFWDEAIELAGHARNADLQGVFEELDAEAQRRERIRRGEPINE